MPIIWPGPTVPATDPPTAHHPGQRAFILSETKKRTLSALDQRFAWGKEARRSAPRSALADHKPVARDPVEMIRQSGASRVEALVALRHGRMLASPFAFFRGTANLQAFDLSGSSDSGMTFPICGDCHLMNFGGFATPERNLVFDINDFDETHPGPWEWDLKRLVASVLIAARHLGHGAAAEEDAAYAAAASYQAHIRDYARMGALEINYQWLTLKGLARSLGDDAARDRLNALIRKAQTRTHDQLLPKIGAHEDEGWKIKDAAPTIFHLFGPATLLAPDDDWLRLGDWRSFAGGMFQKYRETLSGERRAILDSFEMMDLAFKVVGVGSVGTRCLVLLMVDAHEKPLFLQIKEATTSVVAQHTGRDGAARHQGRRVVDGQRRLQASSDLFLGWCTGPSGRHFYVRQLRDMKISASVETYDRALLAQYAATCGWALARAHAKAGGMAPEIGGYIGKGDAVPAALVHYARSYADQAERDFDAFRKACQAGLLPARTDEDFLLDVVV